MQEHPKSEKCANIVPTWPQHGEFRPPFSTLRDPKRQKNDQDEQQTTNKRPRDGQERKKDARERKMCQHGPNKASDYTVFKFPAALPLSMQYFNAA